ncbi:MAG: hypothetical protein Q8R47_01345 [Nanoarchaeota archaeon]|nr:hypothetical protein [Nanoarchaeota archaeon]
MKTSHVLLFLLFVFALLSGCAPEEEISQEAGTAAVTDVNGKVTFNIANEDITFVFLDEASGNPLEGLAVGLAIGASGSQGVLFIVDPKERLAPQMVILRGRSASPTGLFVADDSEETGDYVGGPVVTLTGDRLSSVIQEIVLDELLEPVQDAVGQVNELLGIVPLAAKAIDSLGIPLGKYAETLSGAEEHAFTEDEYTDWVRGKIERRVAERIFHLVTEGEIPGVRSVVIDVASFGFDASAKGACGPTSGGNRIKVVTVGSYEFIGCKTLSTWEQLGKPLAVLPITATSDQYGLPLSTGSLELLSKANVGFGMQAALDESGKAEVYVPVGNYEAHITSVGFSPKVQEVKVTEKGTSIKTTLDAWTYTPPKTPLKEGGFEEAARQPAGGGKDIWSGTLIGTYRPLLRENCGEFSSTLTVTFTVPSSLADALQDELTAGITETDTSGSISGETTVSRPSSDYFCELVGSSSESTPLFASAYVLEGVPRINFYKTEYEYGTKLFSAGSEISYTVYTETVRGDPSEIKFQYDSLVLRPTSISDKQISGVWDTVTGAADRPDKPHGNFILTKQ